MPVTTWVARKETGFQALLDVLGMVDCDASCPWSPHAGERPDTCAECLIGRPRCLVRRSSHPRSQFRRVARNATRAVYIELEGNRLSISMARDYGSYLALSRSSFDRLLPELSTWLCALDLRIVAAAYMGHAAMSSYVWLLICPPRCARQHLGELLRRTMRP